MRRNVEEKTKDAIMAHVEVLRKDKKFRDTVEKEIEGIKTIKDIKRYIPKAIKKSLKEDVTTR